MGVQVRRTEHSENYTLKLLLMTPIPDSFATVIVIVTQYSDNVA